jgi:DNA-nicking Smr family endonuclease
MAKKRKSRTVGPKPLAPKPVFASPFKDLKKMLAGRAAEKPRGVVRAKAPAAAIKPDEPAELDETALLREALAGVRPLSGGRATRLPVEPRVNHEIVSEDAEIIAQLSDLVSGQGPFDITETEEYVEGMRVGMDPRLLARLRRGEFAMQAHIDMHGMIQPAAHEALSRFITESVRKGNRAVLVVHGRGRGSPGGRPVLKQATAKWLSHGIIGGHVLAFATARPADGGAGAMYVLLRRERRRSAFEILEGAKRRD